MAITNTKHDILPKTIGLAEDTSDVFIELGLTGEIIFEMISAAFAKSRDGSADLCSGCGASIDPIRPSFIPVDTLVDFMLRCLRVRLKFEILSNKRWLRETSSGPMNLKES